MKFATIGHLRDSKDILHVEKSWIKDNILISPELDVRGTKGYITGLTLTAREMLELPREVVRNRILETAVLLQQRFGVDVIQLGALTTSVTEGGVWVTLQKKYTGFVNHGDSYTAAVTCQTVEKALEFFQKKPSDQVIAIVGAYGIIGEAVSKMLVSRFRHAILIGRRMEKFKALEGDLEGDFETTVEMKTDAADIIVTATSHPDALLQSRNLGKEAIVVDVSQPPNLSYEVCKQRPDVRRVDGGLVDFPVPIVIPGMPPGKNFACVAEVVMQAMENEQLSSLKTFRASHIIAAATFSALKEGANIPIIFNKMIYLLGAHAIAN